MTTISNNDIASEDIEIYIPQKMETRSNLTQLFAAIFN